jgi:hypothetical protein
MSLSSRLFDNKVMRRLFRPEKDEVIQGWRMLHNEDFHNLYSSPQPILSQFKPRRMRWAGYVLVIRTGICEIYTKLPPMCEGKMSSRKT